MTASGTACGPVSFGSACVWYQAAQARATDTSAAGIAGSEPARVELSAYATVSNRKRLTGAYSDKSPLAAALFVTADGEVLVRSTEGRGLLFHTASLTPKTTRSTQGVAVMTLKPKWKLASAVWAGEFPLVNPARFRVRSLPAAGALVRTEDTGEGQLTMNDKQ